MTLYDIIADIKNIDTSLVIFAKEPWTLNSEAILLLQSDNAVYLEEIRFPGYKYFIEIDIALDFLNDWIELFDKVPSREAQCERIIQYAINDA